MSDRHRGEWPNATRNPTRDKHVAHDDRIGTVDRSGVRERAYFAGLVRSMRSCTTGRELYGLALLRAGIPPI